MSSHIRLYGVLCVVGMIVVAGCTGVAYSPSSPTVDERLTGSEVSGGPPIVLEDSSSGAGHISQKDRAAGDTGPSERTGDNSGTSGDADTGSGSDSDSAVVEPTLVDYNASAFAQGETSTETESKPQSYEVRVVRVVDGDTLEVRFSDGHTENVRLLGVDTPETYIDTQPEEFEGVNDSDRGAAWLEDWGMFASSFMERTVAGENVTIAVDGMEDRRGYYGRLLVYVSDGSGGTVNQELLERGYARLYESTFEKRDAFADAERKAQGNDVGLWSYDGTVNESAAPMGELSVSTIHADAAGNDNVNPGGEWIVLTNTGNASVDLAGWTVSDEADHSYTFTEDAGLLASGESVLLSSGDGEGLSEKEHIVYWGSGAVWNNGGDTVTVCSPNRTSGTTVTYG